MSKKISKRKVISIAMGVAMLAGSFQASAVFTPTQYSVNESDEVFVFDTFGDYNAEYGKSTTYAPNGWFTGSKPRLGAETDDITKSKVVKMGIGTVNNSGSEASGCMLDYGFGKVVSSNKLHYSYKFKSDNTEVITYEMSPYDTGAYGISDHDVWDWRQLQNWGRTAFFRTNAPWQPVEDVTDPPHSEGYISVYANSSQAHTDDRTDSSLYEGHLYAENTWTMVDVFYDFDKSTYDIYQDGSAIGTNLALKNKGLKGLRSGLEPGKYEKEDGTLATLNTDNRYTGNAFGYLDNVYIHEYKEENDSVYMATEVSGNDVSVSFSEYMNSSPEKSDFTVTNATTGEAVDFTVTYSDNSAAVLSFANTLETGVYEVKVSSGSSLAGSVSGSSVVNASNIKIEGAQDSTRHYYLNDSFNDFTAYTNPAGWTYTYSSTNYDKSRWLMGAADISWLQQTNSMTNTIDNSTAVLFDNVKKDGTAAVNQQMFRYFSSSTPLTGRFTIEMDVYQQNGGWILGYVLDEDYKTTVANDTTGKTPKELLDERTNYVLFGQQRLTTDGTLGYSKFTMSNEKFSTDTKGATFSNVKVPSDKWTHIKMDVDTESGKYTATVNGVTETVSDGFFGKFVKGISGIKLMRLRPADTSNGDTGKVAFDNVKIYKEGSYVMNENFDSYPAYNESNLAAYPAWTVSDFKTSGGWYNPTVQKEDLTTSKLTYQYTTKARTYGMTPAATTSASSYGNLVRASEPSEDNYWTGQGRVLSLAGLACTDATHTRQGQSRIQKYFDNSIKPGTPFKIQMDMNLNYSVECFGISMLSAEDMRVNRGEGGNADTYTKNLLTAWTGNYNSTIKQGWAAPDGKMALSEITSLTQDNVYEASDGTKLFGNAKYIPASERKMRRVEFTVTPYYDENGMPKATIDYACYNSNNGTFKGSVTTNQDFMTKESVGIALDMMGSNNVGAKSDSRLALLIDNLKVMQYNNNDIIDTTAYESVNSIKAVKYDGTSIELLNTNSNVIPTDVKRIDITFSSPVSDTITKEGMVSLMKHSGSSCEYLPSSAYKTELSSDKLTYSYILNQGYLANEFSYYIKVSNMVEFADNMTNHLADDCIVNVNAAATDGKVGIIKLNVENPISINTNTGDNGGIVKPIDKLTDVTSDTKLNISGYNTASDPSQVLVCVAYYKQNENGMNCITRTVAETIQINTYGEIIGEYTIDSPTSDETEIKVFAWTYPTMQPLTVNADLK